MNNGIWSDMFGVPGIVADNFLKLATGQQIKVLLYLLRNSGKSCSDEDISANTGVSAEEAADAVMFWQQANIIAAQNTVRSAAPVQSVMLQPPAEIDPVTEQTEKAPEPDSQPQSTAVSKPPKQHYSSSQIAQIMKDSDDISELFKITEATIGTLGNSHMNSIIWMYDYLGLKKEVIVILISYCVKIEKTSAAYIEKIAVDWAEKEINDFNSATEEVQRLTESKDYINRIMTIFEMNHRSTPKQREYMEKWRVKGYSLELIRLAYEKTIEQINKLSFEYINKILTSWGENGYTSVSDVKNAEDDFRKKKKSSAKAKNDDADVDKYNFVINKF